MPNLAEQTASSVNGILDGRLHATKPYESSNGDEFLAPGLPWNEAPKEHPLDSYARRAESFVDNVRNGQVPGWHYRVYTSEETAMTRIDTSSGENPRSLWLELGSTLNSQTGETVTTFTARDIPSPRRRANLTPTLKEQLGIVAKSSILQVSIRGDGVVAHKDNGPVLIINNKNQRGRLLQGVEEVLGYGQQRTIGSTDPIGYLGELIACSDDIRCNEQVEDRPVSSLTIAAAAQAIHKEAQRRRLKQQQPPLF